MEMTFHISVIILSIIISNIISSKSFDNPNWYDYVNIHFKYDELYTNEIDNILMEGINNYTTISSFKRISDNQIIPDTGIHYYSPYTYAHAFFCYVGFRKTETKDGNYYHVHYIAFYPRYECGKVLHGEIEHIILNKNLNHVKVTSIDISQHVPKLIMMKKIYKNGYKDAQKESCEYIYDHWRNASNSLNTKVILSGTSGVGKSYTSLMCKKYIESYHPNMNIKLIIDFDPSAIGVNINELILKNANKDNPVIILINEIDILYKEANIDRPSYDSRIQYTKNKQTFNDMLDAIAGTPYVITIFTSERTPHELYSEKTYRSYMRPGRIDFFLIMNNTKTIKIENMLEHTLEHTLEHII